MLIVNGKGFVFALSVLMFLTSMAAAQTTHCPVLGSHTPSASDTAFVQGNYTEADALFTHALAEKQVGEHNGAGLVRTLLREHKLGMAEELANSLLSIHPGSAELLTSLAEVQLYRGEPWRALETLGRSAAVDPCLSLTHLLRSKIYRLESMYGSERSEVQAAYEIDPSDEEIARAWRQSVSIANDAVSIDRSLPKSALDEPAKLRVRSSAKSMLLNLSESSQTCQVAPANESAVISLQPSVRDGKHIDGYKLEVRLPRTRASMRIDTATSGVYLSRALADLNGLKQAQDGIPGTVYAADVTIGTLEFHKCTLGVSDLPFFENADGYIGTDVFSSYLIKLDLPNQVLELSPLPPIADLVLRELGAVVPGDRTQAAELPGFSPVYHRRQFLLVPMIVNGKQKKLFVLDTGILYTTMPVAVAHSVSTTRVDFTNPEKSTSGSIVNVYRDSFDFEFAGLLSRNRNHIIEMESPAIDASIGMNIGGMLGFDMLHSMIIKLDYRDGLIKLESADPGIEMANGDERKSGLRPHTKGPLKCPPDDAIDRPFVSLITAKPTGLWDSGQLKAGELLTAKVTKEWIAPACRLDKGANLYGHVISVVRSKGHGHAELALVFDHGDCSGRSRQELPLNITGLLGSDHNRQAMHDAIPIEVDHGGRKITDAVGALSMGTDFDLNPETIPVTIHPGAVVKLPGVEVGLHSGPQCSVLLRNADQDVRIGVNTQLLLTLSIAE